MVRHLLRQEERTVDETIVSLILDLCALHSEAVCHFDDTPCQSGSIELFSYFMIDLGAYLRTSKVEDLLSSMPFFRSRVILLPFLHDIQLNPDSPVSFL